MKKIIRNKKLFSLILSGGLLALVLLLVPHFAEAQNIITGIGVGIFTLFFKIVAYLVNILIGFFFILATALVTLANELNAQLLSSKNTLVQIGWTITRDVANLGFVLIMIIMAVATIVRYEKYAVQKLLPLLIGAAILVNFSLTISGVFLNFSNVVSNTFLSKLTINNMGDAVAGAFSPQRLLLKDTENPFPPDPSEQGSMASDLSTAFVLSIVGSVFNILFMTIATFSMAVLALMLFYRYLVLSFLLVITPLAWLFWVFPDLQHLSTKWWNQFLKWVFFLPASTFFLYLAVEAALKMKDIGMSTGGNFTGALASIVAQGGQMIVLAGIMLGGLIVAQSMGIAGAAGAMKLATKAKDATLGFAGRKALQYGSYPLRKKGAAEDSKSVAERLTEKASTIKNPVLRGMMGGLARGATKVATMGGENVLKEHEARVSKMSVADTKAALTTAMGPARVALIKKLSKEKQLGNVNMTSIATKDTADLFARFDQGREFGDIEKNGLMSVKMAEAKKSGDQEALADATNKLTGSMTRKDLETAAIKDLFSGKAKFGLDARSTEILAEQFARSLLSNNPALVPSIIPKLDSKSRNNFEKDYNGAINRMPTITEDDFYKKVELRKNFQKVLANYTMGYSPTIETETGGAAPPPPPSPKP
ncbi:hypothetical protein D4R51_02430 [bacterium]|nr:MAG: hypothetical protein D4R51_02430 [bacterium]